MIVKKVNAVPHASGALTMTVVGITVVLLGAAAVAALSFRAASPLSSITAVRMPDVQVGWRGNCLQSSALLKSHYASQLEPDRIIDLLKTQGWMANYRYGDSVLKQRVGKAGPIAWSTVREIFVEAGSGGSHYVDTQLILVMIGNC